MHDAGHVTREDRGFVRLIGLDRPRKRNAFDSHMLFDLGLALGEAERTDGIRCTVLFAHGEHFTAGLDLMEIGPLMLSGLQLPEGAIDPQGVLFPRRTKPLVIAIRGVCFTIGLDLLLASDVAVAATDARICALEVRRGIFPSGGTTVRFARSAGWSDAMRWMLTGDEFGADEARRMRLVSEVVAPDQVLERAVTIAERIASAAPLGVRAVVESANEARSSGDDVALGRLFPRLATLMVTEDAREGFAAGIERREPRFVGR